MDELRRRAAFWRNLEFNLDTFTADIDAKSADKWVLPEDVNAIYECSVHFKNALAIVRKRYIEVLNAQVTEWNKS